MRHARIVAFVVLATLIGSSAAVRARQLGPANQMMPPYTTYSPTMPNYQPAPVIGGWAPDPSRTYEQMPAQQMPQGNYPQYLPTCQKGFGITGPC
ncbi:MAG: hypothetical protein ACREJM_13300 [Candidatus Saccharimonadales bacterium]